MSDASVGSGRQRMAQNLAGFDRVAVDRPELKQASVAVCIMSSPAGETLLITAGTGDCAITPGSGRCLVADATRASQSRRPLSGNCRRKRACT